MVSHPTNEIKGEIGRPQDNIVHHVAAKVVHDGMCGAPRPFAHDRMPLRITVRMGQRVYSNPFSLAGRSSWSTQSPTNSTACVYAKPYLSQVTEPAHRRQVLSQRWQQWWWIFWGTGSFVSAGSHPNCWNWLLYILVSQAISRKRSIWKERQQCSGSDCKQTNHVITSTSRRYSRQAAAPACSPERGEQLLRFQT